MLNNTIKNIIRPDYDKRILYIFIGNEMRCDDGIAPYIYKYIPKLPPNILKLNGGDKPENIIDESISFNPQKTIIFDAANYCDTPGKISLIPSQNINTLCLSTHTFPVPFFSSLLTHETNTDIFFIGIQIQNYNFGNKLSEAVKTSGQIIIDYLAKEILKCMNYT